MKKLIAAVFVMFALGSGACAVETEAESEAAMDDESGIVDDRAGAGAEAEAAARTLGKELPLELSLVPPIPAGCSRNITCSGAKTCGAWTELTACAAQFSACDSACGTGPGRAGCGGVATFLPQNRARSCVIRATGQTCIEMDYRARRLSCSAYEP